MEEWKLQFTLATDPSEKYYIPPTSQTKLLHTFQPIGNANKLKAIHQHRRNNSYSDNSPSKHSIKASKKNESHNTLTNVGKN